MNLKNIHVDNYEGMRGRAAAGWEDGEARYHVWFDLKTREIEHGTRAGYPTIYKNPPRDTKRDAPNFFDTRYLNATTKANVETIKHVFQVIERDGLIDKAKAEVERMDRLRQELNRQYQREESIKAAAKDLYEALEIIAGNHYESAQYARDLAKSALGKVKVAE